jgi:hypothetical protein
VNGQTREKNAVVGGRDLPHRPPASMDNNNAKGPQAAAANESAASSVGRAAKEVLFNTKNAMISSFASVIETTKELSLGGDERQRSSANKLTPSQGVGDQLRPPQSLHSLGSSATSSRESSAEPAEAASHPPPLGAARKRAPPLGSASSTSQSRSSSHGLSVSSLGSSTEGKMVTINPCQVSSRQFPPTYISD